MADNRSAVARLARLFSPPALYLRLAGVLIVLLVFLALLAELVETGAPLPIDLTVTHAVQSFNPDWFDTLMRFLTNFGYQPWVLFWPLAVLLVLVMVRNWAELLALVFAMIGCLGNPLIKIVVHRPRPGSDYEIGSRVPKDYSFPSGHSATAMIIFGFLAYLAYLYLSEHKVIRNLAIAICVAIILGIGLSRIYLGEHWFSDVIGGYTFGLAWLTLTVIIYQLLSHRRENSGISAVSTPD